MQIGEPERIKTPSREPGFGIGIDLGTTHSLVAIAPMGAAPRVLLDGEGDPLLPSVVSYAGPVPVIGKLAQLDRLAHPTAVIASVKRFMGRSGEDIGFRHPYTLSRERDEKIARFDVGQIRSRTPVEVSADILRVLRSRAVRELGSEPTGAVITVPAYFDDAQRQATKDAGKLAGLRVFRLLAEPTAAALAYGLDTGSQGYFGIYDLGGGTFDVSILRLRDGVFQVLATGGDSALGGDDFDRALVAQLLDVAQIEDPTPEQLQELEMRARAAKEALTDAEDVAITVESCGLRDHRVTRSGLNELITPLVRRSMAACRKVLKDAKLAARELQGIVLVGGSTRVPLVRELVEETFRRSPLADIDPDRVVAHGAAISADLLSGSERDGVALLDVVPLSLGLETMGGIVEKIIPRNSTIPISARQVFTNYSEKQTGMTLHIVQGERELADDCRGLARLELSGIPQLPPSMARVEVTFQLDADALLTVTARELMTGRKQSVEVKPTYGLGEDEIDRLISESMECAQEDFDARDRAESRVELGRVVLAVRTAIEEVGNLDGLLSAAERGRIGTELESAEVLMSLAGAARSSELHTARERLESVSAKFAQRRMERALNAGMGGKTLAEIEQVLAADEVNLDQKRGGHEAERID